MSESKELQVKEKQEVATPAEQTRPGRVFTPAVDIFETEGEIVLLADMPGVAPEDIEIDLRDDMLTLSGDVALSGAGDGAEVLVEFDTGRYYRQFTLSEAIDQTKIEATSDQGVLRLCLSKAAKAVPRKIAVAAS